MVFIKFQSGEYYTMDNQFMIAKDYRGWNVYQSFAPFRGEYKYTCRTLKEAKENILKYYDKED